ncbi:hypothetical protein [Georgenia sp. AZ-5]
MSATAAVMPPMAPTTPSEPAMAQNFLLVTSSSSTRAAPARWDNSLGSS